MLSAEAPALAALCKGCRNRGISRLFKTGIDFPEIYGMI